MSTIVQKFGGTSVATPDRINAIAERIGSQRRAGHSVVVVVSAMGGTTQQLLDRADAVSQSPSRRELDVLLSTGEQVSIALLTMALQAHGIDAVSLTGGQCGIVTDGRHFGASIEQVRADRIHEELRRGRVVVAAGFQGRSPDDEITTLGLGGSDTTAVALAAAVDAQRCDICTDVDGVYSADPRQVADAFRIDEISYTEMVELARHGAGVLNPRSVEYAQRHGVPVRVRSSFEPESPGTIIRDIEDPRAGTAVGIASHDALIPVAIDADADTARRLGDRVLDYIGHDDVFVDRTTRGGERREILIPADDVPDRAGFVEHARGGAHDRVRVASERGSVSAIGLGLGDDPSVADDSRREAERAGIELYGHIRDDHAVTCVVPRETVARTTRLLHGQLAAEADAA